MDTGTGMGTCFVMALVTHGVEYMFVRYRICMIFDSIVLGLCGEYGVENCNFCFCVARVVLSKTLLSLLYVFQGKIRGAGGAFGRSNPNESVSVFNDEKKTSCYSWAF